MSDLNDYPEEHPETGKVKNPLTGNWIQTSYARKKDLLEQAKKHTQKHFREEDEEGESEEIDQLLQEAENVEPGEAFDLSDEELQRLDEYAAAERERLQSFIEEYRERQEAGADMEIAIRGQETRLENLEARIQERKDNVREKGRVVSLAPELVNLCYAFPR